MATLKQSESQQAGFVTEADRTVYEQYASAAAQESFRQGNAAWQAGSYALAWDWLERANRQARDNPHVMFALVLARQAVGHHDAAIELLEQLLEKFDFREGWSLLGNVTAGAWRRLSSLTCSSAFAHRLCLHPRCRKAGDNYCAFKWCC